MLVCGYYVTSSCCVQYASSIFFHRLLIYLRSYGTLSLNSTTSRHPPRASWISSAPSSLITPPYSPPTNTNHCHHSSNTNCSQPGEEVVSLWWRCWPYLYPGFGRFSLTRSPPCVRAASRLSLLCFTPVSMQCTCIYSGITLLWRKRFAILQSCSSYVLYSWMPIIWYCLKHCKFLKRSILTNSLLLMLC